MSTEDTLPEVVETLKFNDVVRFFAGVVVKNECPTCSTVSWEIPVVKGRDSDVVLNHSGFTQDGRSILELKISCNTCGFYRAHKVDVIKGWIANNRSDAEASDE